jgi:hypothetical protein
MRVVSLLPPLRLVFVVALLACAGPGRLAAATVTGDETRRAALVELLDRRLALYASLAALRNAPAKDSDYFRVSKVIDQNK